MQSPKANSHPIANSFALNKRAAAPSPKAVFLTPFWELHLRIAFLCLNWSFIQAALKSLTHTTVRSHNAALEFNKCSKGFTRGWLVLGGPWAASCHPEMGHLSYTWIRAQGNTHPTLLPGLAVKQSLSCVVKQLLIFPAVLGGAHKKKIIFF